MIEVGRVLGVRAILLSRRLLTLHTQLLKPAAAALRTLKFLAGPHSFTREMVNTLKVSGLKINESV